MNAYKNLETLNNRCKYIFNTIQKYGPLTKNQLFDQTQIKLTTLNRDIKTLVNRNLIGEAATAESTGGRKPALYDVNPSGFYLIGIDISRTYTQVIIANLKYKVVAEEKIEDAYQVEDVITSLPAIISDLLRRAEIEKPMIVGIGIGIVLSFDTNELYVKLSKEYGVPITIDNGANAAVIGEHLIGFGSDIKNIAYIHCGVGIRTGVISTNLLIRPNDPSEDALGHMIVDKNGDLCSCGNHGCVETCVSIAKLTQNYLKQVGPAETALFNKDLNKITYRDVCHLAKNNNPIARDLIIESALYFGIGLSNFIRFLNPQLIILSGPLIHHSQLFYDQCTKIALETCHIKDNELRFIKGGYFKEYSISIGAAVMVMQNICQ
nr:ROK family protein [uncultured Acetobacterium sp.]